MGVPRLPVIALVLGACSLATGQETLIPNPPSGPAARIAPVPSAATTELPPPAAAEFPSLLSITGPQALPQPPCRSSPNDYHPNHVYLPEQNPDCCSGGCDGDCHPCRRCWIDMAFFIGKSENLPAVDRRYLCGWELDGGYWFNDERTIGLDAGFFNAHGSWRRVPWPYLIDSPVTLTTFDANVRCELFAAHRFRVDWLLGYRYAQLHERYLLGTTVVLADLANRDQIHAGQIGLVADYRYGPYFAELVGKLAIGRSSEDIDIGPTRTIEHDMCLISEIGLRVGYQFGDAFWGTLGYSLTYLSNVDRPGQHDTKYYVHGLTIGFEKRF